MNMATQTPGVKSLLKELESGRKQLKAEYDKSIRAIDDAIKILQHAKLDASDAVSDNGLRKPGRPPKGTLNLSSLIKKVKGKGARGRPVGSKSAFKGNLTQTLYETILSKKRFVHNRDLVDTLSRKFPKADKAEFGKKISVLLASLKKQGRLVTYQDGGYRKNMYWGVPEWMNENKIARGREFQRGN